MLLSYTRLCELVSRGVVSNVDMNQINGTSIDITLGDTLMLEDVDPERDTKIVTLKGREKLHTRKIKIKEDGYFYLLPGQFVLAHSRETFNLPLNISAEYKLKSSMARIGLEHLNAGWCDPGWNNSVLTLELKNMTQDHVIALHPGVRIGQMVFFEHEPVPLDRSYSARGRYNGDKSVQGVKE